MNAVGPFYVEDEMCIACGTPESHAPELMSHEQDSGHCYFFRQPLTAEEVDRAILAIWSSCCGAIRYGGNDPIIIKRLAQIGEADKCDRAAQGNYPLSTRSVAAFTFDERFERKASRAIFELILAGLRSQSRPLAVKGSARSDVVQVHFTWYEGASAEVVVERLAEASGQWVLRLHPQSQAATVGCAVLLDDILRADPRVTGIRWYVPYDWDCDRSSSSPLPY